MKNRTALPNRVRCVSALSVDQVHAHQEPYTAVFCRMCEPLSPGEFRGGILVRAIGYCLFKLKINYWFDREIRTPFANARGVHPQKTHL